MFYVWVPFGRKELTAFLYLFVYVLCVYLPVDLHILEEWFRVGGQQIFVRWLVQRTYYQRRTLRIWLWPVVAETTPQSEEIQPSFILLVKDRNGRTFWELNPTTFVLCSPQVLTCPLLLVYRSLSVAESPDQSSDQSWPFYHLDHLSQGSPRTAGFLMKGSDQSSIQFPSRPYYIVL